MGAHRVPVRLPSDTPMCPFSLGCCRPSIHLSNIQPPFKFQQRFLLRRWKWPGQALGRHRRENIFFLSGLLFHSLCFPFCSSFAISQLSKFTGALPQGEMKAPGRVWWCRRGGMRVREG